MVSDVNENIYTWVIVKFNKIKSKAWGMTCSVQTCIDSYYIIIILATSIWNLSSTGFLCSTVLRVNEVYTNATNRKVLTGPELAKTQYI